MNKPVVIVEYNPQWPQLFDAIADQLAACITGIPCSIEHIGSSSIPGLASKDILDIIIVLERRSDFPRLATCLVPLGFAHVGDQEVPGREVFRYDEMYFPNGDPWPRVHLYAGAREARTLTDMLRFRDLLRTDGDLCRRYAALKRDLARRFVHDRVGYTNAKTSFVLDALSAGR